MADKSTSSKKVAAAPAKSAAKPAVAPAATAAKAAPAPAPAAKAAPAPAAKAAPAPAASKPKVDAKERQRLIQEAAYYRALKRGFTSGNDVSDWLAAEREVDARLGAR